MSQQLKFLFPRQLNPITLIAASMSLAFMITSCGTQQSQEYEATAVATSTWRVNYSPDPMEDKRGRYHKFESVSLTNRNGKKPEGAVYQDDKGIWWPKNPPKPSVDEVIN